MKYSGYNKTILEHKKITYFNLFLISLFFGLTFIGFNALANEDQSFITPPEKYVKSGQITYCSQLDNPPFDFLEQSKPTGLSVDLATRMAALMGLKPKWLHLSFSGMIPALKAGQCDMIVEELYIKPKRKEVIDFLPFAISAEQIAVRKGNDQGIKTIDDLSGKKVAVATGTTFESLMQQENKKLKAANKQPINILSVPDQNQAYNLVMTGNADAIGGTLAAVAYHQLTTSGSIEQVGAPFHKVKDGFGFRKDEKELKAAMKKALSHMVENGEYKEIFKKYDMGGATLY